MNYSPDHQIKLPDGGSIPMLFNTWAYKKFCALYSIELEDFLGRLKEEEKGKRQPLIKYSEYSNFFLCAAESWCKYNNKEFTYTELDACGWMDIIGGYRSQELVDITIIAISKLMNTDPSKIIAKSSTEKGASKKKAEKD